MKITVLINLIFVTLLLGQTKKEFPQTKIPFNPEKYICYRTSVPILIDGKLNEEEWGKAKWTKDFVDIEGDLKPKPYYKTNVKMLWDDNYFYFAAKLEEPNIWAKLKQRDTVIFYDNDFEIFIDPDGDTHKYYEFEINALNTVWDLVITKPYRDDNNVALNGWNIKGLKTAVSIEGTINNPNDKDKYWIVEVAYPWKALAEFAGVNTPPADKDYWRVNFSRVQWETEVINGKYVKKINQQTGKHYPENNWVWSPQGLIAMHAPETWGYVFFVDKNVGEQACEFKLTETEKAKWNLRKIYYAEHNYLLNNGKYTSNYNLLDLNVPYKLLRYNWPPKIKTTNTQFEAILKSKNGKKEIIIYQDGLVKVKDNNYEK